MNIIKIVVSIIFLIWAVYDYIKIVKHKYTSKKAIITSITIKLLIATIVVLVPTTSHTKNIVANYGNEEKNEDESLEAQVEQVEENEDESLEEVEEQQVENESIEEQGQQSGETTNEDEASEEEQEQQVGETTREDESLEQQQQQVEQPPQQQQQIEQPQQEVSQNTNIHKNSINGIEYKLLNQADPQWKDVKYPTRSGTIGKVGCMITTVAVVSSAYDQTMTPKKVMDAGYQHSYPSDSVPHFSSKNFTCTMSTSPNKSTIISNLKQGNPVIIMVKGGSAFTTSQHYMALIDIKSDESQVFVGNAYDSGTGTYNRTGWFDTGTVLYDMREMHICVPSQNLINKY